MGTVRSGYLEITKGERLLLSFFALAVVHNRCGRMTTGY